MALRYPQIADKIVELLVGQSRSLGMDEIANEIVEDSGKVALTVTEILQSEIKEYFISFSGKGIKGVQIVAKKEREAEIIAWLLSTGGFTGGYEWKRGEAQRAEENRLEDKRIAVDSLKASQEANEISKRGIRKANFIAWIALIISLLVPLLSWLFQKR